jgi:hypothetical protein
MNEILLKKDESGPIAILGTRREKERDFFL